MSESLSQADIDHIREGYRLFREADPAWLERYEPDATVTFPETLPSGGTYASPWEALEFWASMAEHFDDPHPEPDEFIRDGDRVVVLGRFHGRSKATDEQITGRFAHVFGLGDAEDPVSEQKFSSLEVIMDTATVLAALPDEGPA